MRGRRAAASASQMLLIRLLVSTGPLLASAESDVLMDSGHSPPPGSLPDSSGSSDSDYLLMDLSQDTAVGGLMPVVAQVVSGSTGGVADGMYACMDSASKCVHLREPRLRLEDELGAIDQLNREAPHTPQTIVGGSTTLYSFSPNMREGGVTTDEDWIWLDMATDPPRHARSLNVLKVRDTGCSCLEDRTQRGRKGDIAPREAALEAQLGDVYTYAGRLTKAVACYKRAATADTLSGQQRCHVDLALCTVTAKQARAVRTSGPLSSEREEAACISSVLAKEGSDCSADDATMAHITVGVFRLSEEWDTGGALDHFVGATAQHKYLSVKGEEGGKYWRKVQGDGFEWGPVWLTQAIRGQAHEASVGFAANATVVGDAWATTHLRSWRRHLERKCSGIGMGGIIEGAERLILAGTLEREGRSGGESGRVDGSWHGNAAVVVNLHLALARMLILHGAFEEAGNQVRAAEKLATVEEKERSANGDVHSLHLEMALLSRIPVVLGSGNSAIALRRELLVKLERLGENKGFLGSIPNPLEMGVRAQFLATYQGLNDKAIAIALARTFNQASGGTLSYLSPHLRSASGSSDEHNLDKGGARVRAAAEQAPPSWNKMSAPSADAVGADVGSQYCEIPDTDAHVGDTQTEAKGPKADVSVNEEIIRVGFVSSYFRWHSVGRLAVGLLEQLSRSVGLEIFVIDVSADGDSAKSQSCRLNDSCSLLRDKDGGDRKRGDPIVSGDDVASHSITTRLAAAGASIVKVPLAVAETSSSSGGAKATTNISAEKQAGQKSGTGNRSLQRARQTVAALELDVLVFGDVGMDALTTGLAYGRLSPVQIAFWGHPSTTGLPTVDYFVTSDIFEGKADRCTKRWCGPENSSSSSSSRSNKNDLDNSSTEAMEAAKCSAATGQAAACGDNNSGDLASRDAVEWEDRQGAFSEQLVRLDGLGIVFDDPVQTFHYNLDDDATSTLLRPTVGEKGSNDPPKTTRTTLESSVAGKAGGWVRDSIRASGGSSPPEGDDSSAFTRGNANRPRLYVCAQSLMKMHPSFDAVLVGILIADPLAHIVLLRDSRQLLWHSRFRRRLRTAVDDAESRSTAARFVNGTAIATVGSELCYPRAAPSSDDKAWKRSTSSSCSATLRSATSVGTNELPQCGRVDIAVELGCRATIDLKIGRKRARRKEEYRHHPKQQAPTATMGDFWNRVRFVSPMSGRDFFRLQCRADVVLDPFPFGGGVTMLEALTCGTPVVTAGVLQSVHRLAEGMIIAAAGAAAVRNTADHEEEDAADAGAPVASTTGAVAASIAAAASLEGGGKTADDGHIAKHHSSSDRSSLRTRERGFDRDEDGVGRRAGTGAEVDAVPSSDDACSLVNRLVAVTTDEYVTKAVALAAPGELRECIVRALGRGRDGLLRGDGGVARDWERFLRVAAASPTQESKASVFH